MRKTRIFAALAATTALALAGCTGGGPSSSDQPVDTDGKIEGEITFQTWSLKNEKFSPYFEKLVKDFEEKYPGTSINWIDQPGEGYEQKVLQQANSNELPDVVNLPDTFAYQLAQAGKLVDLKKADPELEATYVAGGLEGYTFEDLDGTWAYPWYLGTDLDWWNMAELKEYGVDAPPTSHEEWIAQAKQVAEKSGGKVHMASSLPTTADFTENGIDLMNDGKFAFNTPEAEKVLQEFVDLYQVGAMPAETLNGDYAGNAAMFTQGKVAYTTATPSFVTQLTDDAPSMLDDVKPSPRFMTPPLFVQGISVSQDSKNPALALEFAKFATNNENQIEFVKLARGFLPGTKAANENPEAIVEGIEDPLLAEAVKIAASQMDRAKGTEYIQFNDDMNKFFQGQVALAMQGKATVKEALDAAVDYCNKALD